MITVLFSSLIEQLNENRRTCHIAMKVVLVDSLLRGGVQGHARAACAEVSKGPMEASKAILWLLKVPYGWLPVYTKE
jgi:hypothetical protein